MVCHLFDLISQLTPRTGTTVALPPTSPFNGVHARKPARCLSRHVLASLQGLDLKPNEAPKPCASTQLAARRVLDLTRDWLQTSPSTP